MDLDHLKKLVDACHEEAEKTNDTVIADAALDAYLLTVEPAKGLAAGARALRARVLLLEQHVQQLMAIVSRNNGWLSHGDQQVLRAAKAALEPQEVLP